MLKVSSSQPIILLFNYSVLSACSFVSTNVVFILRVSFPINNGGWLIVINWLVAKAYHIIVHQSTNLYKNLWPNNPLSWRLSYSENLRPMPQHKVQVFMIVEASCIVHWCPTLQQAGSGHEYGGSIAQSNRHINFIYLDVNLVHPGTKHGYNASNAKDDKRF